jgi:hypothetical protein
MARPREANGSEKQWRAEDYVSDPPLAAPMLGSERMYWELKKGVYGLDLAACCAEAVFDVLARVPEDCLPPELIRMRAATGEFIRQHLGDDMLPEVEE